MVFRLMQIIYLMCIFTKSTLRFKITPYDRSRLPLLQPFLTDITKVHNLSIKHVVILNYGTMLESNNRSYLTIAIGYTIGKHHSVYVAE